MSHSLTPLDVRKMTFPRKMRGVDADAVAEFLEVVADELAARLGESSRLGQENQALRLRLTEAMRRQEELQESLLHAQRLSKEITDSAKREADLLIREAQVTADNMVAQSIEQANKIESKILELRTLRRDFQSKLRSSLDLFSRLLETDMEDEQTSAVIRTLPRRQSSP
ncbi:MAG: DivIVA domain-containing protein [Holophagales bacterium]|nr:DivIVA domain-containing protein [Holophagales bacterium]